MEKAEKGADAKPKPWDLEDDFEFSPPKPEGDPWKILLHPLLKKDKIQCDAWKEEVQNLLIFAGLFSAVVTAFVIESYKALQPDPNAILVDLLSQMARSLNGTSPGTSVSNPSFSPTSSAIRVNIFWFTSLILSLATVLVGIISLQWLREYQSYPNFSPKETISLFHMRSDGFDRWYVKGIFTSLPLLLQAALVLFFGGMMDFLLRLVKEVAIPVIVVIGLTLFFLVATTILPTLQGFYLYLPFLSSRHIPREPSQCPYKSPQSQALRAISEYGFHFLELAFPTIQYIFSLLQHTFKTIFGTRVTSGDSEAWAIEDHHILPLLPVTWRQKAWIDFDLSWLALRDACIYGRFHQAPRSHRGLIKHTPLFDVSHALRDAIRSDSAKHTTPFISAAYYCFQDLSASFLAKDEYQKTRLYFQNHYFDVIIECNRYFSALFDGVDSSVAQSPMNNPYLFIDFASVDDFDVFLHTLTALHHQNLYMFLTYILDHHTPAMILRHRLEVQMRLMKALYGEHHMLYPSAMERNMPEYLALYPSGIRPLTDEDDRANVIWQYSRVIMDFFQYASRQHNLDVAHGSLHAHPDILLFLFTASEITYEATHLERLSFNTNLTITKRHSSDLTTSFADIFTFITDNLKHPTLDFDSEANSPHSPPHVTLPSYLFYTASIYVQHLLEYGEMVTDRLTPGLEGLISTLREHKIRLNPSRPTHPRIQEQFKGKDWWDIDGPERFSSQWWSFLDHSPSATSGAATTTSRKSTAGDKDYTPLQESVRLKYLGGPSVNLGNTPWINGLDSSFSLSISPTGLVEDSE